MDPFTHALVGAAIFTADKGTFSISNPASVAAIAGSVIPDGDIILQLWGDSFYLKHHRGVSHSLPGIGVEAGAIALVMKLFYGNMSFKTLFIWALLGGLSHIIMDVLNSYGAKVLWPLSRRMHSLSLLTITDPVIIVLSILAVVFGYKWPYGEQFLLYGLLLYILVRVFMRVYGVKLLRKEFGCRYCIEKISLLPSMIAGYKFHYIVHVPEYNIVGEINFILKRIRIIGSLKKIDKSTRESILKSKAAAYFKDFTPIFHVSFQKVSTGYEALLTDLRYMLKNDFLHHATVMYDANMNIIEEKFNPYSMKRKIDV